MAYTVQMGNESIELSNVAALFAAAAVKDNFTNFFTFSGFPEISVEFDNDKKEVIVTFSYKGVQVDPMRKAFKELNKLLKEYRKTKVVNLEFEKEIQRQLLVPLEIKLRDKEIL